MTRPQVGGRVEGMERLVESVFAPGGALHEAGPEPLFRGRRDAAQQRRLEQIKAEFDAAGRMGDPHAFFHMKVGWVVVNSLPSSRLKDGVLFELFGDLIPTTFRQEGRVSRLSSWVSLVSMTSGRRAMRL